MNQTTDAGVATTSTSTKAPVKARSAPPFKLSSLQKNDKWLKLLFYGKHGSGKTTLAGSAVDVEHMRDVFMINVESGDMVLDSNDRVLNPDLIDVANVDNFKAAVKMYEFLSSHVKFRDRDDVDKLREIEAWLRGCTPEEIEEPRKYRTVIIDSLTELEAYCLYNLLGIHGDFDAANIDEDIKNPEFAEYKKNNNMVNLLVRAFRDLPMNVIIICGETYEQDELKRFHYAPSLTGKLRSQIQGYFDIVGYLATGKASEDGIAERRLFVQPVGKWDAKCRRPTFKQPYFQNPTMLDIMSKLGLAKQD